MAWQNPKTNWKAGDVPAATDFNRIEGNVQELQNTKETPAGAQAKANTAEANAKAYTDAHEQKAAPHSGHETPAGAQAKAEAAAGAVQADLDEHLADIATQPRHGLRIEDGNLQYLDGVEWKSIPPVQILEEVIDFTETDITITHNNTEVVGGSLQLIGTNTSGNAIVEWNEQPQNIKSWDLATYQNTLDGETVSVDVEENDFFEVTRPDDDNSGNTLGRSGLLITAKKDIPGILCSISILTSNATKGYLYDATRTNLLATANIINGKFEIIYPLVKGTDYRVLIDNAGSTYTRGSKAVTFPITSDYLDIIAGDTSVSDDNTKAFNISKIESIWVSSFTDINQNFDISTIDPTHRVRFKVNLSRASTANNPTCDYLARRFVR